MNEFGHAQLGDKRLTARLCELAERFAEQPTASIPQATENWGQACAAYRFFSNQEVSSQRILASHRQATLERIGREREVLVVQDTTSMNFTTHRGTSGLGPIGSRPDTPRGFLLHTTQAFTTQRMPLGLLAVETWTREAKQFGGNHQRNRKALADKESARWVRSLQQTQEWSATTGATQWVVVADREADLYELFDQALGCPHGPKLLVRVQHDRALESGAAHLKSMVRRQARAGELIVSVPRRPGQSARKAHLTVRYCPVRLRPPHLKRHMRSLELWVVEAREEHPAKGIKAIGWQLLTTVPIYDYARACEVVGWYATRWQIEVFHRVLKSGCCVEQRQLQTVERLQRAMAIDLVVAWRILQIKQLGESRADGPAEMVVNKEELQILSRKRCGSAGVPKPIGTLQEAIRAIASLGGFLGRRGDGAPGPTTLWRGLQRLNDMSVGWQLAQDKKCA